MGIARPPFFIQIAIRVLRKKAMRNNIEGAHLYLKNVIRIEFS